MPLFDNPILQRELLFNSGQWIYNMLSTYWHVLLAPHVDFLISLNLNTNRMNHFSFQIMLGFPLFDPFGSMDQVKWARIHGTTPWDEIIARYNMAVDMYHNEHPDDPIDFPIIPPPPISYRFSNHSQQSKCRS